MVKGEIENLNRLYLNHRDQLDKRLNELDAGQRACFWLDLCSLKQPAIYLLQDFNEGLKGKFKVQAIHKLRELKASGAVLFCLSEMFMTPDATFNYTFIRQDKKYEEVEKMEDTLFNSH